MSSRKAASKQISYKDESSSEEDSEELDLADKKIVKKGRRSQKKQKEEVENESSESEFELDKEKPKGKKGKGKARGGGGKKKGKGKEKEIRKNPFDVLPFELFVEILSYLSPKDLLHLARTNKSYRSILFSKQRSESIWKRSLESVKLPIPTASDWALPAYAHLVFHVNCLECDKKSPAWMDPWFRIRLCKSCRQDRVVKLTESLVQIKEYHPLIKECVGGSHYTSSDTRYLCTGSEYYVFPADVEEMNERLIELQEEDSLDDSADPVQYRQQHTRFTSYSWVPIPPTARQGKNKKKSSTDSNGAQRSTRSKVQKQSYYEEDSEDEDEKMCEIGPRVESFLNEKKDLHKKINEDALAMRPVVMDVVKQVKSAEDAHKKRMKFLADHPYLDEEAISRRFDIAKRLNALKGYESYDLDLIKPKALAEFLEGDSFNDADWKRIKPTLLHLIDAAKAKERLKELETRLFSAESKRKNSLRRYYDKVLDENEEGPFPPLFIDFLLLPSVQSLWRRQNEQDFRKLVTGIEWIMKRDAILIDLQDYHLDLVEKVVRLIISTTREYSDVDEFEALIERVLAGNLDAFFSEATSMLFCDGGCEIESYAGWFRMNKRKVAAHFDTFPQVVKHQLETHNDYEAPLQPGRQEKHQSEVGFRFTLPLEIASVMSDLVDVVRSRPVIKEEEEVEGSSESLVMRARLDTLNDGNFSWTNALDSENYFTSWTSLVERIYVVARKAAKSRPPLDLDPPDIRWSPPVPVQSFTFLEWGDSSDSSPPAKSKLKPAMELGDSSDEEKPDISGEMEEEDIEFGEGEKENGEDVFASEREAGAMSRHARDDDEEDSEEDQIESD